MKIYLAGPMRGIPEFNFPAFHKAAALLREFGAEVFSPAERDEAHYGATFTSGNATGSEEQAAKEHGFNLREALAADLAYICHHADAIALLPGWQNSKGVAAELATARALGLKEIFL
jgi:nucleoside 2-deoxyribosyltransferase